jgi:hypothetical protein
LVWISAGRFIGGGCGRALFGVQEKIVTNNWIVFSQKSGQSFYRGTPQHIKTVGVEKIKGYKTPLSANSARRLLQKKYTKYWDLKDLAVIRRDHLKQFLQQKNPAKRFTAKMLTALRREYSGIKTIDPGQASYKKLTAMLDNLPQAQLKQLAKARIKFVSSLANNRIKRKSNPVKKKRSAKQLANDRRLGRMAKARAKVARKNPHKKKTRRKVARKKVARKTRRRNPRRVNYWVVFRCKGSDVQFITTRGKSLDWTLVLSDKIRFNSKSHATSAARAMTTAKGWQYGVTTDDILPSQIRAKCNPK